MDNKSGKFSQEYQVFSGEMNIAQDSSPRREIENNKETLRIRRELDSLDGWFDEI